MFNFLTLGLALTVAGASETAERTLEYQPVIGVPQSVSPGTTMLSARTVSVSHVEIVRTVGDFADAFGLVRAKMHVPNATKLQRTTRGFCTNDPVYSFGPICFIGTDPGAFNRWQMLDGGGSYKLHNPLRYEALATEESRTATGSVYTITYLGVSTGTVRVSYREFTDGIARPAFTEDLTFDKPSKFPATVALKGYKIAVDSIDNQGLSYRVLSNP